MSVDIERINYYTAFRKRGNPDWRWMIYHYDATGERQIPIARAQKAYGTKEEALDAAAEHCDDHSILAEYDG